MAGIYPVDAAEVQGATELLTTHKNEQVKIHTVVDAQGRPKYVFTAWIGTQDGGACMCSEYVYLNPTSTIVIGRQERVYRWKSTWDAGFVFDPTVSYDADGDGNL